MNKALYTRHFFIALLLVVMAAAALWFYRAAKKTATYQGLPKPAALLVPAEEAGLPEKDESNVLNLALPKNELLVDPIMGIPEERHNLKSIFKKSTAENPVSVGGRLIVDENPPPNAGMWDKVKGAEVGITIKTP